MVRKTRVAVVWTEISGYLSACLRALSRVSDIELLVISDLANRSSESRRSFTQENFAWITDFRTVRGGNAKKRCAQIGASLLEFHPEVVIMNFQWRYLESYFVMAEVKRRQIFVVAAMDNTWADSVKQRAAILANRSIALLRPDAVWVPGERSLQYARRLFGGSIPVWMGLYSADSELFTQFAERKSFLGSDWPKSFLYVGRFSPEKGLANLLRAYDDYRNCTQGPWDLVLVGSGDLQSQSEGRAGVRVLPFQQPSEVARLMASSGAFVLPSWHEPWGVVLHEAALSGLPIICSDSCGASVELVQNGFNGFVFPTRGVAELKKCLVAISTDRHRAAQMGQNSMLLGRRVSTTLWAQTLVLGVKALRPDLFPPSLQISPSGKSETI
jgi:glycosyltransferase involved in cell wall biosynthesis